MALTQVPSGMIAPAQTLSLNGVTFPATQVSSADANTLDDYEEGSWTPVAASITTTGTVTTNGRYTKVGNLVTAYGTLTATTISCANTTIIINGLPFSSINVYANGVLVNGAITQFTGLQVTGGTGIYSTAISSTNGIYFSITYFTNS
jgi:hypothetical protein